MDDEVFRELADGSRRRLLDRLNERNGQTLHELCIGLEMTRQSVSKHLAVLEAANLVSSRRRGREKLHFLNPEPINAIAEPRRREILVLLRDGERPVTEMARDLGMSQPQASKHLRVLREVGLVRVREAGKQRLYGLDARGLRPIHEWVGGFEQFWSESFDRLEAYVEELKQARQEELHHDDNQ